MPKENRALKQAQANYVNIVELLTTFKKANKTGSDEAQDEAQEAINDYALSVEVKKQYIILLSWGGPATRIIGDIDKHGEPQTAHLQFQDWGTYWEDVPMVDMETLMEYARHHYFNMEE